MKFSVVKCTILTYILVFTCAIKANIVQRNELCKKLLKSPNFNLNVVLDKPWRFYYTWLVNMGDRCMDMTFMRATKKIIDRIGLNMDEYMREKMDWDKATMMTSIVKTLTMKSEKPRETLMFPENGIPGGFRGVPNVRHNVDYELAKNSVPTTHYVFKLFKGGKFLIMADCHLGLAALMVRLNDTLYRSEILALADEVWEEDGYPSCSEDKNENEVEGSLAGLNDAPKDNKIYE